MSLKKKINFGATFTKSEKQDDGSLIVGGICSSEAVDSDGEVILSKAMADAIPAFMQWATLKEMHKSDTSPGVITKMEVQEDGMTYMECHVVDLQTVAKVEAGVYKGFSIGANKVVRDALNKLNIIGFELREVSLVDRPANPDSIIAFAKMDKEEEETPEVEIIPEVAKADEPVTEIKKGLYTVARLAQVIDDLKDIQDCFSSEAQWEGDNSEVPSELKAVLISLFAILNKATVEETSEIKDEIDTSELINAAIVNLTNTDKSIKVLDNGIEKAGSRNSASDLEKIQKIHDLALELGATSPGVVVETKSDTTNIEIAKFEDIQKSLDNEIAKTATLEKEKEELSKRVKELEDLPRPRKGAVTSISKSQDIETKNDFQVEPILDSNGNIDVIATGFKKSMMLNGLK